MRPDTLSKLAVSVAICAAAASSVAVGLANSRIDDLEIQRDIYKSRAEDWEGTAGVIAQYADDLADELKIRSKLDEKLDVEYSAKPDETRKRIVELLGDVPRIELFARKRTPGWDAWGDELE